MARIVVPTATLGTLPVEAETLPGRLEDQISLLIATGERGMGPVPCSFRVALAHRVVVAPQAYRADSGAE